MTKDGIVALYRRERAREETTPGHTTSHASVLGATRTEVHLALRQEHPELSMPEAWLETDRLVRDAGIWDGPPDEET